MAGPEAALPSEYVWSRGAALLAQARAYEAAGPLGIRYLHADVTAPGVLEGQVFDGVVCNYGLTDIDDLDGLLANVARWLRPGGAFVFSLLHPCFPAGTAMRPAAGRPVRGTTGRAGGWPAIPVTAAGSAPATG